jgi:hypothetical protein
MPFRILVDLVKNPDLIAGAGWMTWLAAKNYDLFAFTLFTHVYNIFNLLFTILIAILFYQRRSSFPRLMTIEMAMNFAVTAADTFITRSISESPASVSFSALINTFIFAAIWIPYLNISTRVKETFVLRNNNDDDEESGPTPQPVEQVEQQLG